MASLKASLKAIERIVFFIIEQQKYKIMKYKPKTVKGYSAKTSPGIGGGF